MELTLIKFPDTIYIDNLDKIHLSGIEEECFLNIKGLDYIASFILDEKNKPVKGGNSHILKLNYPNEDDLNDDDLPAQAILKICKNSLSGKTPNDEQKVKRFKYEINALLELNDKSENIVRILAYGKAGIKKIRNTKFGQNEIPSEYYFYVMEFAEYTLPTFLKKFTNFSMYDKIDLCHGIANGLNELQKKGYYHRDIKADNILFVDGVWKIGDLGLAANQNDDKSLDIENEKIGPYGWLSPEVMNKVLTENKTYIAPPFDCIIDFHSDFFQIGKLFWYIFQGNLPIGNISEDDFRVRDHELFEIIFMLLQYEKGRRPKNIEDVNSKLTNIQKKYYLEEA